MQSLKLATFFSVFQCYINYTLSSMCHGSPKDLEFINNNPIHEPNLEFIREFSDPEIGGQAILYRASVDNDTFNLLHLFGDPYQVGYNHGKIIKDQANDFINGVYKMMEEAAESEICKQAEAACKLKPDLVQAITDFGINEALDLELKATDEFRSDAYEIEMLGLSTGAEIELAMIRRIHMLGELTKASCSMFGAWGEALEDKTGLLQVRTLDWNTDPVFVDNPQVTIYHPASSKLHNENRFANVGFPGWIGVMTGMNDKKMGISEIGAYTAADSPDFPSELRKGQAFTYMLRDVLQYDTTADQGLERMQNANRTCNLILGLGDGNKFHGIASDAGRLTSYNDKNQEPLTYIDGTNMTHPRIENIVYWGMDWYCAPYHDALANQLLKHYGKINAKNSITDIIAGTNTGSTHIAVYDYNNWDMYVSFARQKKYGNDAEPDLAWQRSYTRLPMLEIFETKATVTTDDCICSGASTGNFMISLVICVMIVAKGLFRV